MVNYEGEKFLDKLYNGKNGIYNSPQVQHVMKNGDKRHIAIRKYLERLDKVHSSRYKETLLNMYYDKYVIKEDTLYEKVKKINPNISEERIKNEVEDIINNQKRSLKMWLDYLSDETAHYPLWAKYWAFQGMLKMGMYDEAIEGYQKRSKDTEGPFVDANPEIIARAISIIEKIVNKEYVEDENFDPELSTDSFSKMYTILEKKYTKNIIDYSNTEGKWVKYNQDSIDDAKKLAKSLENKNTHWCTADSSYAEAQLCGGKGYTGGDFYVYYTKDKNDEYTLPRIAIRMKYDDRIGEIRGILEGQNLEEEMLPILESKLHEMAFVTESDMKDALEKVSGLKELTDIYKKTFKNEELSSLEINNLYTKKYGFGWNNDPRVDKTIIRRNPIEDFNKSTSIEAKEKIYKDVNENKKFDLNFDEKFAEYFMRENGRDGIKIMKYLNLDEVIDNQKLSKTIKLINSCGNGIKLLNPKDEKYYEELAKVAVCRDPMLFEKINFRYISNYEELVYLALEHSDYSQSIFKKIDPTKISDYEKLAREAIKRNFICMKYVDEKYISNYDELARISIENSGFYGGEYIDYDKLNNPEKIAKIAVKTNSYSARYAFKYLDPKDWEEYSDFAEEAVEYDAMALEFINPGDVSDYNSIASYAVEEEPLALQFVKKEYVDDYNYLVNEAVENNWEALTFVKPEDVSNYDELVKMAIDNNPYSFIKIPSEYITNYDDIAKYYISKITNTNKIIMEHVNKDYIKDYEGFVKYAVSIKPEYIRCVEPNDVSNYEELVKKAVRNNGHLIKSIDRNAVQNYDELVKLALTNNPNVIEKIKREDVSNYDEIAMFAVNKNASAIYYIDPSTVSNYDELAREAVSKDIRQLENVRIKNISNYDEFVKSVVSKNGYGIRFVDSKDVSNYQELVNIAIANCPSAILFVDKDEISNYDELLKFAIGTYPDMMMEIDPEEVSNYEELAHIAVNKKGESIENIKSKYISNFDSLALEAVENDGLAIRKINPEEIKDYGKIAMTAANNNLEATEYVKYDYVPDALKIELNEMNYKYKTDMMMDDSVFGNNY